MKKKAISLLLAMTMSFSIIACGKTEGKETTKQENEVEGKEENLEAEKPKEDVKTKKIEDTETEPEIETVSLEDASASQSDANEEKFIEDIKNAISGAIGEGEFITDVSFANGDLRICVDITQADPSPLTFEDLALSRTSSITDNILGLNEYLDTWTTITVDFGTLGHICNGKDNIADDGYGPYFKSSNFAFE